jgi:hypothetical protein
LPITILIEADAVAFARRPVVSCLQPHAAATGLTYRSGIDHLDAQRIEGSDQLDQ